jgi:hypothetical protein
MTYKYSDLLKTEKKVTGYNCIAYLHFFRKAGKENTKYRLYFWNCLHVFRESTDKYLKNLLTLLQKYHTSNICFTLQKNHNETLKMDASNFLETLQVFTWNFFREVTVKLETPHSIFRSERETNADQVIRQIYLEVNCQLWISDRLWIYFYQSFLKCRI